MRFSGVPTARIFPPTTSRLASFIFTTTPGSMVSTERTVTLEPFITYTYPSSQTVGSSIAPETSIILQDAIGSSVFSMPSSVEQAMKKWVANKTNSNFFILKIVFVINMGQSYWRNTCRAILINEGFLNERFADYL